MSIRNTPEHNRIAAATRRERLREAGYRVLHTEIPGPTHDRLHTAARARKLTVGGAVTEAIDAWATANEKKGEQ
ncbi:MAG: hypothetical protein ABTR27_16255 [Candidatus Competibacter phosphatis]